MTDDQKTKQQKDLEEHGAQDIIPEDEEYYTLDLKRDFDGEHPEKENVSITGENPMDDDVGPLSSSSFYAGTVVEDDIENSESSNSGGIVRQSHITDQDPTHGAHVGDPGHPGIDDDTG